MIVNTKTGIFIAGTIVKEPTLRHVGQYGRAVLKTAVRYGTETGEDGKSHGKLLDVDVWDGAEDLDGMLAKGDPVIVTARGIKERPYNGKTYYSVDADGVFPAATVVFRWMQQIVDMIPAAQASTPASAPAEVQSADIGGHEMYPGEQLTDYTPEARAAAQQAADEAPIEEDLEDLPF